MREKAGKKALLRKRENLLIGKEDCGTYQDLSEKPGGEGRTTRFTSGRENLEGKKSSLPSKGDTGGHLSELWRLPVGAF